jgi:hypothetical protein
MAVSVMSSTVVTIINTVRLSSSYHPTTTTTTWRISQTKMTSPHVDPWDCHIFTASQWNVISLQQKAWPTDDCAASPTLLDRPSVASLSFVRTHLKILFPAVSKMAKRTEKISSFTSQYSKWNAYRIDWSIYQRILFSRSQRCHHHSTDKRV